MNIRDFPLAWRWTDPKHAVLSVLVWPEEETWVLVYDHEEHFEFGRKAAN